MPLHASLVERLFEKLTVRYGTAFMRQYADLEPAAVKADWAEVLEGFDRAALSYALRYLPTQPPNANAFREICRRAPEHEQARIAGPTAPSPCASSLILCSTSCCRSLSS